MTGENILTWGRMYSYQPKTLQTMFELFVQFKAYTCNMVVEIHTHIHAKNIEDQAAAICPVSPIPNSSKTG